jgi:hypothetical protein
MVCAGGGKGGFKKVNSGLTWCPSPAPSIKPRHIPLPVSFITSPKAYSCLACSVLFLTSCITGVVSVGPQTQPRGL